MTPMRLRISSCARWGLQFDRVIIVDWSASNMPSPARECADAIWIGVQDKAGVSAQYHRTRHSAEAFLQGQIAQTLAVGERALIGFDFPLGYPAGFAHALTGVATARSIWAYLAAQITDTSANQNNRFHVANAMNTRFGGGPFWGRPAGLKLLHLPAKKDVDYAALPFGERREIERRIPRAQPVWKLFTTGSVGSQSLMGLPMIHRLSGVRGVCVWPFDPPDAPIVLAEVYPSLLSAAVAGSGDAIKDRAQVLLLAKALGQMPHDTMARLLAPQDREEGWILGAEMADVLAAAL
jgi:hypothetical protein